MAGKMKESNISIACVHEYFQPYYLDKDAVQVPAHLSSMLNGTWAYLTRPSNGVTSVHLEFPIIFVGPAHSVRNASFLKQNLEAKLTFSTWWMIRASARAALKSNVLVIYQLRGRTCLGGLVFKIINFLLGKTSFVYIKMDSGEAAAQALFHSKTEMTLRARLRNWGISIGMKHVIDMVSAESSSVVDILRRRFPNYLSKMCIVLNCPSPAFSQKRYSGLQRKNQLLIVGRLGAHQKGTDIAFDAFARFHVSYPDWRLVLAGPSSPGFDSMLEKYGSLVDSGIVHYCGNFIDKNELGKRYQESKIFLFPSRYEGASIALVEACSFGCVPVCTPVGNARDVLGSYFAELTVPIDDTNAFAKLLIELAGCPADLDAISDYLLERTSKFRWDIQLRPVVGSIMAKTAIRGGI